MSVSRRQFLNWSGLLAGTTMTLGAFGQRGIHPDHSGGLDQNKTPHPVNPPGIQPPGPQQHPGLLHMTKDSFAPHVGSGFKISQGSQTIWIRLISAQAFPIDPAHGQEITAASAKKTTTYMLRFLGSSAKALPQDIYTLEHDKLGTFKLLLVPSGDGQQLYAAIVNHLQ